MRFLDEYLQAFKCLATHHFAPLVHECKLHLVEEGWLRVQYESDLVSFTVLQGQIGDSVDIDVALKGCDGSYNLKAIADWANVEAPPTFASSVEVLDIVLQKLANFMAEYAKRLMVGESRAFATIRESALEHDHKYTAEFVKPDASEVRGAMKSRDYDRVVDLLDPVRGFLSPSERKLLELAKKRSGRS